MSVGRRSDDSLFVAWRLCPFGRVRSPSSFKSSKAAQIKNPGSDIRFGVFRRIWHPRADSRQECNTQATLPGQPLEKGPSLFSSKQLARRGA